ncbi:DUF6892 domain-containing protein [Formosa algae]|uniref:Uncharacterized protein n=1 Tax=Formosa algae TaxID=225843 RepID=A0A9X1CCC4_9FLAO|nr:hypothetical protein [Formosa algae]MBP1840004.1 hypothetical protein [Formosa algae]MDQ0335603.1 hypothetical protein [Formosa algae]OEI81704.1 hypothetical protein AST99_02115 [Formosa algae]
MFNLFKKKANPTPPIVILCSTTHIKINGKAVSFPIHLNTLIELLGEPSKQEHDVLWRVVWDDLGIYTEYATWDKVFNINCLFSKHHKLKHHPKRYFKGEIKVNDRDVLDIDFIKQDLIKHSVQKLTYKDQTAPYAISIGKNFNYKAVIPKDKYEIKDLGDDYITFSDFGFKLAVIQELMYHKEFLTPKFDLIEFIDWYDKRTIDLEEEGYTPIPEVTEYFKNLQIPKALATELTEIYQDGGNDIYLQLLRFGEGWEEYWDIETTQDAAQFPNLKTATICYAKGHVVDELQAMGIQAKWI